MEEIEKTQQEQTSVDKSPTEEQKGQNDSTYRLRDEKGQFISNPDKKPKRTSKQKEADNSVKIRIVKDEEQEPNKTFEGRLEDLKERTAINFIKSVCYHKPREIKIDGMNYYSQDFVEGLTKKLANERKEGLKVVETLKKAIDALVNTGTTLEECYDSVQKVRRSCLIWKSIAIGLLATLISFGIIAISKHNTSNAKDSVSSEHISDIGNTAISK